jgi:primosomal protein DnaI
MAMKAISDLLAEIEQKKGYTAAPKELMKTALQDPEVQAFFKTHHLQASDLHNSWITIFNYVEQKKHPDPVMKGYQAELFMNDGQVALRYRKTQDQLAREQKARQKRNLQLIDLPQRLHQVELSKLDRDPGRKAALAAIGSFLLKFKDEPHLKGYYLSGDFGVGKTYMLAAMANQAAEMGKRVVFLHVPTFIAGLSSHFEDHSLQDEIERVATCDLLILDDIGAESLSPWSRDDVLGVILQRRMDEVLPTWFSSNFDKSKLADHFANTRNAVDPVKAARLMQRVDFLAPEIVVSGPNRR